jgi:hypothetical protein
MRKLITADWHVTDRPGDGYRFDVLRQVRRIAKDQGVDEIINLGDLTEQKDFHAGELVNRLVDLLEDLAAVAPVTILKGNHDYVDPQHPFFNWLRHHKNLEFITDPETRVAGEWGKGALFLPHVRNPEDFGKHCNYKKYSYIFAHQIFTGAKLENGELGKGVPVGVLCNTKARIYSGDVHVPQSFRNVVYVGAPYPVHFGSDFQPRVLIIDDDGAESIALETPRRLLLKVTHPDKAMDYDLRPGDQVKVEIILDRTDFHCWQDYRQEIQRIVKDSGAESFGIKLVERKTTRPTASPTGKMRSAAPEEIFDNYCRSLSAKEMDSELQETGRKYLDAD